MLMHLAIAIILGAVLGVVTGKLFGRANMGVMWNAIVGALGGIVVSTYLGAFGVDEHDPFFWSFVFSAIGGVVGVVVIGLCRPGLSVFWDVLTGKTDGVVERK